MQRFLICVHSDELVGHLRRIELSPIVLKIPPMTILPLVLTAALYICLAKNKPGSCWTPSSIQDKKYNFGNLETFRLSYRAKK